MEPIDIGQHLEIHPRVCFGKLIFKGTRIPVETVLVFLAEGWTFDQILESWPDVKREAVVEAVQLATAALLDKHAPQIEAARESVRRGRSA